MMRIRLFSLLLLLGLSGALLSGCLFENQPPRASFAFSPQDPEPGELITFDGTGSYDPDGHITSYRWEFGDGSEDFGPTVEHSYTDPGSYTVTLTVTDDKGATGSASRELTILEPGTIQSIPTPGDDPQGLAWDGTSLWNVDATELKLFRLDPETGLIRESFTLEVDLPTGLAWDGQNLWLLDSGALLIYKLDRKGKIKGKIAAPGSFPQGLAWDGESLWVSDFEGQLYKVRPSDGEVLGTLAAPGQSLLSLAWAGSSLWVADLDTLRIYEVDPASGQSLGEIPSPGPLPVGLTWDGTSLWVADGADLRIYRITPP
jgi:PKD repeat protein